ncbi:MAG TPA: hypothetical protein VIM11_23235 [Tepidisphaeraceae bacterium]|jgi:hypothetical protein
MRTRRSAWPLSLLALAVAFIPANAALARIKLITLPPRERVEIQLDNASATLVEEERVVPLNKGANQVDFSWANTQIDPSTIVFRVIAPVGDKPLDVKVLSVSYPPNEQSLVWAVGAGDAGSARVRISYLLGNLNKSFNYRAIASRDEKTLVLSQYIRLQNLTNEEYGATQIWAGFGKEFLKPIGLNETREMLVNTSQQVRVRKTFTASLSEFGWLDQSQQKLRVPMHYVIKNDTASRLGAAALPYGKVRIFIAGPAGNETSTTFLGEDWGKFTPVDDDMRLYLGVAQDIVVKRTIENNENQRIAGNLSNQNVIVKYEIENFKDSALTLDIGEDLRQLRNEVRGDSGRDVQWELGDATNFEGGPDKQKSTFDKLVLHVYLPARGADGKSEKFVKKLHVILKNEW